MSWWLWACLVSLVATAVFAVGIIHGTFAAADTDPYGYVSQAELIAQGRLQVEQQFARSMPWPNPEWSFAPDAYVPGVEKGMLVPTYSPGLPLVMAAFQRVSGERTAVFYVVPLLGALAVWMTALLGAAAHGRLVGFLAALVLATSPAFLYQVVQPVSDAAATAWWTLALVLVLRAGTWSAAGAALAASMAILTRPNLVFVAAVMALFLLTRVMERESAARGHAVRRLLLFTVGIVPACVIVALINTLYFGSPLKSGYGDLESLFGWQELLPNLDRYPRWLLETQTPLIWLWFLAPFIVRTAAVKLLISVAGVIVLSYLFYGFRMGREEWSYLRFLLPAYPPMIVLNTLVMVEIFHRLFTRTTRAAIAAIAVAGVLAVWQGREAEARGAFVIKFSEQRYVSVARYVAGATPRSAVIIAGLHAGSIRYYADRLTINFSRHHPRSFDAALDALIEKGYRPYIALEEGEEERFRQRFAAHTDLARLDWPPSARTYRGVEVRIYDPADRPRYVNGEPIVTWDIDRREPPVLTER